MKMNEFIARLKQQPRLVDKLEYPTRLQKATSQPATQSAMQANINEQVRQLAQQLANQIVAEQRLRRKYCSKW
jgi:hypothetical protein